MSKHPYSDLTSDKFWSTAAARIAIKDISNLFTPKHRFTPNERYATYGSCFAQRFSGALISKGFNWVDAEPVTPFHNDESKKLFNYEVFSSRTGNIYTCAMLLQWIKFSLSPSKAPIENWVRGDRFYDPLRPTIEPGGFLNAEEIHRVRLKTLTAFKRSIISATVFVFTMGLTEGWRNRDSGLVYSMCPGVVAGKYTADAVEFVNFNYTDNFTALEECISLLRQLNPTIRILLTVSPVPNIATAEKKAHIITTNSYSKSTLRAVAGDLEKKYDFVDYFPSYELITAPPIKSQFYNENLRTVTSQGVEFVMSHFFRHFAQENSISERTNANQTETEQNDDIDDSCDEILLEAFNDKK